MVMNFLRVLPGEHLSCVYSCCQQAGAAASHTLHQGHRPTKAVTVTCAAVIQEWGRREHNGSCLGKVRLSGTVSGKPEHNASEAGQSCQEGSQETSGSHTAKD